jgi:ABC-type sugar transport system substrate-binding protein
MKNRKLKMLAAVSVVALAITGSASTLKQTLLAAKITFIQGVAGDAFYVTMGCGVAGSCC